MLRKLLQEWLTNLGLWLIKFGNAQKIVTQLSILISTPVLLITQVGHDGEEGMECDGEEGVQCDGEEGVE